VGIYIPFAVILSGYFNYWLCDIVFFYRAYGSGKEDNPMCDVPGFENSKMKLLRHVSFVDCPVKF
jgi:translation initiation factor 2 gamma subunit (eIF-2gamma)